MGEENICSSLIYFLILKFWDYGGEGGCGLDIAGLE